MVDSLSLKHKCDRVVTTDSQAPCCTDCAYKGRRMFMTTGLQADNAGKHVWPQQGEDV